MDITRLTGAGLALALLGGFAAAGSADAMQAERVQPDRRADGTVTGVVLAERTREPVVGARVVMDDGRETETDVEGHFAFSGSEPGPRQIAALIRGCRTAAGSFQIEAGEASRLELLLDDTGPDGDGEMRRDGADVEVITGERLKELEHLTLLAVVKREVRGILGGTPTVTGRHTGLSNRGSAGLRAGGTPLLLLNDTRVEHRVSDVLAEIPAGDAVRVEVTPGSSATIRHGPAAAYGLIRVFMRNGPGQTDPGTPASACRVDWGAF